VQGPLYREWRWREDFNEHIHDPGDFDPINETEPLILINFDLPEDLVR
jgi:hypothetical protein